MPNRHSTAVPDPERLRQLVIKAQKGDKRALQDVIDGCRGLVGQIATRYVRGANTYEDCIQNGLIGLLTAVEKFDERRGTAFTTMAVPWIRQACQRGMEETGFMINIPSHIYLTLMKLNRAQRELRSELRREPTEEEIAARAGVPLKSAQAAWNVPTVSKSLDEPCRDEFNRPAMLGEFVQDEVWPLEDYLADKCIREAVEALPEPMYHVICLRYGLYGDDPMSLRKVGTVLGLSAEGVRLQERRALGMLRKEVGNVIQLDEADDTATAKHQ